MGESISCPVSSSCLNIKLTLSEWDILCLACQQFMPEYKINSVWGNLFLPFLQFMSEYKM